MSLYSYFLLLWNVRPYKPDEFLSDCRLCYFGGSHCAPLTSQSSFVPRFQSGFCMWLQRKSLLLYAWLCFSLFC